MMKLKFNPRYRGDVEGSIFLLDEPGSYLHSTAQSELLKELKLVSKKNTIIYCTHSQYLLAPSHIRLGAIKIAKRKNGMVNLVNFGEIADKDLKGTLAPVYEALDLNISRDFIGNVALVEGIGDFCMFSLLTKYHKSFKQFKLSIIPAAGASKVSHLIGFALGFSEKFGVFLDRDEAGNAEYKRIEKYFGSSVLQRVRQYGNEGKTFVLENFISSNDQQKILNLTKAKKFKKALPILFWEHPKEHENIFKSLSKETEENLLKLAKEMESLFLQ